ncbi:MAG: hypothetical protein JXA57_01710 [Armatimonadetes bacterium]|nr:hypothetical protein [Armatimonadota bacterium]
MTTATTKSPAAPSRSLETCYEIASKIYDSYSHTDFGAPEIAGAVNLSAGGSQGKSLVSDLKQYGLVEKVKAGRYVISQEFKHAHTLAADSTEFKAAMYEFVKRPSVFQKVLVDVKGKLPDETALANNLRATHQFNPEKARSTAKALSESLSWVGVLDAKRNIIEHRPGMSSADARPKEASDGSDAVEDMIDVETKGKLLTLDIPLADGRTAHVRYPFDLSPNEAEKIGRVLAAICG